MGELSNKWERLEKKVDIINILTDLYRERIIATEHRYPSEKECHDVAVEKIKESGKEEEFLNCKL